MTPELPPAAEPVDAIVLAGSVNRIPLFPGNTPGRKALVELHGTPLIDYVLDALHESPYIGRIVVVGAPEVLKHACRWREVQPVADGHALIRNAWRGLHWAQTERVLFCNPDQPLLRTEMIDYFVPRALAQPDADVVSSWVRSEDLGCFAEAGEHKLANFGDGRFAHGNLFLVRRQLPDMAHMRERLDRLYQARKSNTRFAWELGLGLFGRYLASLCAGHLPSLEQTLKIGGDHFGVKLGSVICPHPEIALDIDEPEDYTCAEQRLADLQRRETVEPHHLRDAERTLAFAV